MLYHAGFSKSLFYCEVLILDDLIGDSASEIMDIWSFNPSYLCSSLSLNLILLDFAITIYLLATQ